MAAPITIRSVADVSTAMGYALEQGSLLLSAADLGPEFFDLRSGLAGVLMQKFVNFRIKLAIVIADPQVHGERFSELVYEHRSHSLVRFFSSEPAARAWLDAA
jgi:hypothetical protein